MRQYLNLIEFKFDSKLFEAHQMPAPKLHCICRIITLMSMAKDEKSATDRKLFFNKLIKFDIFTSAQTCCQLPFLQKIQM